MVRSLLNPAGIWSLILLLVGLVLVGTLIYSYRPLNRLTNALAIFTLALYAALIIYLAFSTL
ncbi:MAG: hypothetical protein AAFX87_25150 [Bacteroidota bacterium]